MPEHPIPSLIPFSRLLGWIAAGKEGDTVQCQRDTANLDPFIVDSFFDSAVGAGDGCNGQSFAVSRAKKATTMDPTN